MNSETISPEVVAAHNLTPDEYQRIKELLGREPTFVELGIFSVMWSEHCSYKSSRVHLKRLPTTGERVIVPPGENAGVVDVGDGWCAAFKVESHNHPSFIEPFQGAATGVGGILRDIFTMGARPVAAMNSLRFGSLDDPRHGARNRSLLAGVVAGISQYGNCLIGDERIVIKDRAGRVEWVPIGDFCERFADAQTEAAVNVERASYQALSFDEATSRAVWSPVKSIFKRQAARTLLLKTAKGRTLRLTPDHPVLIDEDGKLVSKPAAQVKLGEAVPLLSTLPHNDETTTRLDLIKLLGDKRDDIWISYPMSLDTAGALKTAMLSLVASASLRHRYQAKSRYPLTVYLALEERFGLDRSKARLFLPGGKANRIPAVIEIDQDFARLIGYYLAEGCTSRNGTTDKIIWVFGNNASEQEYVNDLCRILDRYQIRYSVRGSETTRAVWLSSWFLGTLFRDVLQTGAKAHKKAIPDVLACQPPAIMNELLKGLFRGDGSIIFYPPEKGSRVRFTWATVSRRLFEQVLMHLHTMNIIPSIYVKGARETVIRGRRHLCRPAYYLEFRDYESIRQIKNFFSTSLNERLDQEQSCTNGTLHSFPRHRRHKGYVTVNITDIQKIDEATAVYDMEIEGTHNFVTSGGIITHNCFGVATVGGEVAFDDAYAFNPLVNAFALGLVRQDQIFFGRATGIGNPVLYVGAKTGRDGIHGATMASAEFDDEALEKRPTVQVGDPFLEKLLLEACLEVMRSGAVAGIQDMGAAGLTSSSCEMAGRAGNGLELDLSLVPQREAHMTAYEMMLSESQERMLIVAHKGREREVVDIFRKWDLDAVVIGRVTDTGQMRVIHGGETVAEIPVPFLTDQAPLYQRPVAATAVKEAPRVTPTPSEDYQQSLRTLLGAPNIASKEWVYTQYDHMVRTNTTVLPGADAAVVRIKETRRALAMCLDGNGRYCAADPFEGAKLIVAEAARNVVCVGARPIALTNCLNFASPERPEVMWQFARVIDGMGEACRAFNTPVISGNVSFYNETEGRGIWPTPVIGMVGLIEDQRRVVQAGLKKEGDVIALLGETRDDLSISEYAVSVLGQTSAEMIAAGRVPVLDLEREQSVQEATLEAIQTGETSLLASAHDCSDGGLAVALAESCFSSHNRPALGATIEIGGDLATAALLFGESPSRVVVSFPAAAQSRIEEIAARRRCPLTILGRVGGDTLEISVNGTKVIAEKVQALENVWRGSLVGRLHVETLPAAN